MAAIINADDGAISGASGLKLSSDTSGALNIQTNGVTAIAISASQVVSFPATTTITFGSLNVTNLTATTVSVSAATYLATASGNVGIGTSSPAQKLDVTGAVNSVQARFGNVAGRGLTIGTTTNSGTNDAAVIFNAPTTEGAFLFQTVSDTKMTLSTSGNLGLGVTPSAWGTKYRAIQLGNNDPFIIFGRTDGPSYGGVGANVFFDSTDTTKYINSDFASVYLQYNSQHLWYTAPSGTAGNTISFTQAMTLTSGGDLLVGTTSGVGKIQVESTGVQAILRNTSASGYTSLRLYNDQNSAVRALEIDYFGSSASGGERAEIFATGAYHLAFGTSNTERARITSGGNVGIGTNAPTYKLDVNGITYLMPTTTQNNPVQNTYYTVASAIPTNSVWQVVVRSIKSSNEQQTIYHVFNVVGGISSVVQISNYTVGAGCGNSVRVLDNFPSDNDIEFRVTEASVSSTNVTVTRLS